MYSIYKFTNLLNGKVYIGKTSKDPAKRRAAHERLSHTGKGFVLHHSMAKHGTNQYSFDVIFNTFTEKDLNDFEVFFISEYDCCLLDGTTKGYNMTRGGEGLDADTARRQGKARYAAGTHNWSNGEGARLASERIKRRTLAGTNPWAGELGSSHSKAMNKLRMANGTHHFTDDNWQAENTEKTRQRVADGTHHWVGDDWSRTVSQKNKDRVALGKHVWQSDTHKQNVKERIKAGTHHFGKKAVCQFCSKEASLTNITKWHNERCLQNPNCDIEARKAQTEKTRQSRLANKSKK